MSGPRDPNEHEAGLYRSAIENKDAERLHSIIQGYPNIVWGSVTRKLAPEDQQWLNKNL